MILDTMIWQGNYVTLDTDEWLDAHSIKCIGIDGYCFCSCTDCVGPSICRCRKCKCGTNLEVMIKEVVEELGNMG